MISLCFHCAADVVVALVLSLRWCFRCAGDVVVLVISLRWWFCCARDFFPLLILLALVILFVLVIC